MSWRSVLHTACEVGGVSLGFQLYLCLRRGGHDLVPPRTRFIVMAGALVGALAGSKLLGWLEDPGAIARLGVWQSFWPSGRTIIGGLLGGLFATEWVKKLLGYSHSTGDQLVYPVLLALAIGRIGCFIGGLEDNTYGVASALPWGIDFGDGIRRHPTQLYDVVYAGTTALVIYLLSQRVHLEDGARFKLFLSSYLLFRFGVDFLKPYSNVVLGLCTLQLACLGGLLYYRQIFLNPRSLLEPANKPSDA